MSAAQGDLDQKPSMEHGYLGPIFDVRARVLPSDDAHFQICATNVFSYSMLQGAEALSLAETYEKLSALANLQSEIEARNCNTSLTLQTRHHRSF